MLSFYRKTSFWEQEKRLSEVIQKNLSNVCSRKVFQKSVTEKGDSRKRSLEKVLQKRQIKDYQKRRSNSSRKAKLKRFWGEIQTFRQLSLSLMTCESEQFWQIIVGRRFRFWRVLIANLLIYHMPVRVINCVQLWLFSFVFNLCFIKCYI